MKARFSPSPSESHEYVRVPEQVARHNVQKALAESVFSVLPAVGTAEGFTLVDAHRVLQHHEQVARHQLRPAILLEALHHLQFAGLVKSSAHQFEDDLTSRRYWSIQPFQTEK